jgi:hypothetical protein
MSNLVSVEPLQDAFKRSGREALELADLLGFRGGSGYPDGNQFKRYIGLIPYLDGKSPQGRIKRRCNYHKALEIAEAIGVDPVDVGL